MSSEDNIKLIRTVYDAFARGDIPGVLDLVDADCDWGVEASVSPAPYYGVRRGRGGVLSFFQELGSTFSVDRFEPIVIAGDGNDVLAVVAYAITSTATGRSGAMDIHHHFKVDGGKITYFRGSEDTGLVRELLAG